MFKAIPAITGRAYFTPGSYSTKLAAADTAYAVPFVPPMNFSFDQIGVRVTTAGVGSGADVRLSVYIDNNGRPGKLLNDFGAVTALTSTGAFKVDVVGSSGRPMLWADQLYWLVSNWNTAATTQPTVAALATAVVPQGVTAGLGTASIATIPSAVTDCAVGLSGSYTYAAAPADGSSITWSVVTNATVPLIGLRAA